MKPTPEQIIAVEIMRDRLADRLRVVENDGEKSAALTALLTNHAELTDENQRLRELVDAANQIHFHRNPYTVIYQQPGASRLNVGNKFRDGIYPSALEAYAALQGEGE
jgi:hypothetical protein